VTEDELNALLKPVDGRVIPPFTVGVSSETRDETKKILETNLTALDSRKCLSGQ